MTRYKKPKIYSLKRNHTRVGSILKDLRVKAGLTQRQVSNVLQYSSPQFISNFERGIHLPPLIKLKTMIGLYNANPRLLIDTIVEEKRESLGKSLRVRFP